MNSVRVWLMTSLTLALCTTGCTEKISEQLPTTSMQIGSVTYTLEIAANDAQRARGLMFRDQMPAEHGMIFIFDDEQVRSFWMKNTRIPLDIIYLSDQGKVVSIKSMKPFDEKSVSSEFPARFAIELNAGQAQRCGILPGDVIIVPPSVTAPTNR
jgi:uncharacterized membrane protein (UPF0127 family)